MTNALFEVLHKLQKLHGTISPAVRYQAVQPLLASRHVYLFDEYICIRAALPFVIQRELNTAETVIAEFEAKCFDNSDFNEFGIDDVDLTGISVSVKAVCMAFEVIDAKPLSVKVYYLPESVYFIVVFEDSDGIKYEYLGVTRLNERLTHKDLYYKLFDELF
jgi:hypothetical protein